MFRAITVHAMADCGQCIGHKYKCLSQYSYSLWLVYDIDVVN